MLQPPDHHSSGTTTTTTLTVTLTLTILAVSLYFFLNPTSMSRLLGQAKTTYYHNTKTSLPLSLKPTSTTTSSTANSTTTTLAELCKSVIPPCNLNPFLFNGHLQTLWTVVAKTPVPIHYKRRFFENEDSTYTGTFAVDFVVTDRTRRGGGDKSQRSTAESKKVDGQWDEKKKGMGLPPRTTYFTDEEFEGIGSDDTRPMLITLHGLTGGSHELYLRQTLWPLVSGDGGWEACVVISRGCSGTKVTTNVLYNARATWDVRQTVKWLRKKFPNRPFFGCGFSLGANIITNYIAEEGVDCEFKAAVVVSSPWNLDAGSIALQSSWIGLNVYSKAMGGSLKKLFEVHAEQVSKTPNIDVEAIRNLKYLHEFDRLVQCPTWGYPTEGAYYRDASSTDALIAVRIPLLALNADDDPIASGQALPRIESQITPYTVLCTTSTGGHIGWFEFGGGRWFPRASTAFLQAMARDVELDQIPKSFGADTNGEIVRPDRKPLKPVFQPTRRKLDVAA